MEFRLATEADLPQLETMFLDIVKNMDKSDIHIWNEYYPFEEFECDINNSNLWLLTDNKQIISAIGLFNNLDGQEGFHWKDKNAKAIYISRLGINVDYLRQGYAKTTLDFAKDIAKQQNAKYLRLLVADINKPAINLYLKNNFLQVKGVREEYSPTLNKTINEFGFELKL